AVARLRQPGHVRQLRAPRSRFLRSRAGAGRRRRPDAGRRDGMTAATAASRPSLWQRMRAWAGGAPAAHAAGRPVRAGGTAYRRPAGPPARVLGFDQALLWVGVLLLAFSVVMVYSASIAMPHNPRFGNTAATHFLLRHAIAIGVGFVAA